MKLQPSVGQVTTRASSKSTEKPLLAWTVVSSPLDGFYRWRLTYRQGHFIVFG